MSLCFCQILIIMTPISLPLVCLYPLTFHSTNNILDRSCTAPGLFAHTYLCTHLLTAHLNTASRSTGQLYENPDAHHNGAIKVQVSCFHHALKVKMMLEFLCHMVTFLLLLYYVLVRTIYSKRHLINSLLASYLLPNLCSV